MKLDWNRIVAFAVVLVMLTVWMVVIGSEINRVNSEPSVWEKFNESLKEGDMIDVQEWSDEMNEWIVDKTYYWNGEKMTLIYERP